MLVHSFRVAPPAPAVGFEYSPEELDSFTAKQRLWIAEHPRYWELRSQSRDDSDDDFRDPLESPTAGSSTTGTNNDGDTTMNESDGTVKGKSRVAPPVSGLNNLASLSVKTPVPVLTLPTPRITDTKDTSSLTRLHELALRNAAIHGSSSMNVYKTNVGRVFKDWSFSNCPRYNGSVEVDVKRWLGTLSAVLDSRQAHPDIWHLVGFRLLEHKAFLDYEDAINSGNRPLMLFMMVWELIVLPSTWLPMRVTYTLISFSKSKDT
ncbi:hypothetical protein PGT21_011451 [Puccinia graminis f. sp. tritici]|uniref:Uncharacterized protein n=1 Tax=Puccinia graminis f. sp. tritici TaxID=56615 RepID=A0A5B0P942_PUCGR|nr:hypothetical protein PGT21_011451 [Puccinia graminis f. sp. tritici]